LRIAKGFKEAWAAADHRTLACRPFGGGGGRGARGWAVWYVCPVIGRGIGGWSKVRFFIFYECNKNEGTLAAVGAALLGVATVVVQHRQLGELREENRALRVQARNWNR